MKKILFLLLSFTLLFSKRVEIDLHPIKNEEYAVEKKIGIIGFNFFSNKNIFFFQNDISKLNNPIYTSKNEKIFWLLTDGFIDILKRYKFIKGKYIYFAFFDVPNESVYRDMYLKIKLSTLQKFDNRDFSKYDKNLISNDNIKQYKLLPIRKLFKSAEISLNDNHNLKVSKRLTKEYQKFIDEYTFNSIGKFEFTIENNIEKIQNLKRYIHNASIDGNLNKIKLYIKLGFDIDKKDKENQQTLLQYASFNGHFKIVKLLIDNGANPNIHNENVENAYLGAKRLGFHKIASLLKPITKMTKRPKISTVTTSGSYQTCFNIKNEDIKNSCLAQTKYGYETCFSIQNEDIKNSCLAQTKYGYETCFSIQNENIKNSCLAQTKYSYQTCFSIQNEDIKNSCLAQTKYSYQTCFSIQNEDMKNSCLAQTK